MNAVGLGFGTSASVGFAGRGFIGGQPPVDEGPDGRYKQLNQPRRGRVYVLERSSFSVVASVLSDANGVWVVRGLSTDYRYMVIGVDGAGSVNAAIQDWVAPYVAP